jgi:DNA-binding NarL/FixJ family response regulator
MTYQPRAKGTPLTPRRLQILEYIGKGCTNAEIASYMGVKYATIDGHVTVILRQVGATNRTEAAVMAARQGWI